MFVIKSDGYILGSLIFMPKSLLNLFDLVMSHKQPLVTLFNLDVIETIGLDLW